LITNRQREQLMQLATKDPLTGAGNRRSLDAKLDDVVNNLRRSGTAASMLFIDLDHFKKVNDVHGHRVGDQILKRVTEIVNLRIRVTDSLYRIGGEEFIVVLEGQDRGRAQHLAEQLRTLVHENELVPDRSLTISLGVAELSADETALDWMRRADEALWEAKRSGRNTTSVAV
jgi:diguanylate cyclase (GGDEF)-like protein